MYKVSQIITQNKMGHSVEKQQQRKIISAVVWLRFYVSSRPSSDQYFPVEGTNGVHYALWDSILFTGCA